MNRSWLKLWGLMLTVATVHGLTGCTSVGINLPRDDGPSTAEFRYEVEYIPNAQLVRLDTRPKWPLGRYAFRRGADRLIVVSRITSVEQPADSVASGQDAVAMDHHLPKPYRARGPRGTVGQVSDARLNQPVQRQDTILERVWITIPLGTQIGDRIDIEDLEDQFLTGYDEGDLTDEDDPFTQPIRLTGVFWVLEEQIDSVIMKFDLRVDPKYLPSWNYKETVQVPVSTTGIRATMVPSDKKLLQEELEAFNRGNEQPVIETGAADPPTETETSNQETGSEETLTSTTGDLANASPASDPPTDTESSSTGEPDGDDPDTLAQPDSLASADPTSGQPPPSVIGKWITNTPSFEYRFQFDADGKFIYANTRGEGEVGGYAPGMMYGGYKVKGNTLVLFIDRYEFASRDHMSHIKEKIRIYKISQDGDSLVMNGYFPRVKRNLRLKLAPADFPDMNVIKAPKGRSGVYDF